MKDKCAMKAFENLCSALVDFLKESKMHIHSETEIVEFSIGIFRTKDGDTQFTAPAVRFHPTKYIHKEVTTCQ